jgi:hypothetical protein
MTVRYSFDLADDTAAQLRDHSSDSGVPISEIGRRAIARVVAEPAPYRFGADGGDGPCLVKDLAVAKGGLFLPDTERDEADERLRRFEAWSADLHDRVVRFDMTTANTAAVVPTGYLVATDLVFAGDRPLWAAANRGTIADATNFRVPRVNEGSFDVIDQARTEDVAPAVGTITPTDRLVAPATRVGRAVITRELVDAATPQGDAIALAVAAEDYRRQVEADAYAELNGATFGQGGTITAGFVPTGAQARTSAGAAIRTDLTVALAEYAQRRLAKARNVIVGGTTAHVQLAPLLDDATGDDTCVARVQGARINWATTAFGGAAGDADALILSAGDFYVWESPTLRLRFDERSGPALVEVITWAYAAAALLRPRGLSSIRHT